MWTSRLEDHFFTAANRVLYERFNMQSAFSGRLAPGHGGLPLSAMACLRAAGPESAHILLRSGPYFLQERQAEGFDAQQRLELLLAELARSVLPEFFPTEPGAMASLGNAAMAPKGEPLLAFVMIIGASPLEVRLWKK